MRNRNKCYVAMITSKWHLYGLESYLLKHNYSSRDKVLVFVIYHESSGYFRVSKDDFSVLNTDEIKINFVKSMKEIYAIVDEEVRNYNEITVLNAKSISYGLMMRIKKNNLFSKTKAVIIDEGLGSYVSDEVFNTLGNITNNYTYKEEYTKKAIRKVIGLFIKKEDNNLFLINNNLELQKPVSDAYKNYFNRIKSEDKILRDFNSNSILIISDNLGNLCKKNEDELVLYNNIISKIKMKFPDKKIYIKPHPNEMRNISKFDLIKDIEVLQTQISFEDFINNNSVDYVMGFSSTSLITCSNIFNKKSYCLNNMLDKELLSDFGYEYIEKFISMIKYFNINTL